MPSGRRMPCVASLKVTATARFAPALSPTRSTRSPVQPDYNRKHPINVVSHLLYNNESSMAIQPEITVLQHNTLNLIIFIFTTTMAAVDKLQHTVQGGHFPKHMRFPTFPVGQAKIHRYTVQRYGQQSLPGSPVLSGFNT